MSARHSHESNFEEGMTAKNISSPSGKKKKEVRRNLGGIIENVIMRSTREEVPKMDNKIRDGSELIISIHDFE